MICAAVAGTPDPFAADSAVVPRADDCIARMMRKSNRAMSTSTPRYSFCRASDYWFATKGLADSAGYNAIPMD